MAGKATIAEIEPEEVRIRFFLNASYPFTDAVTVLRFLPPSENDIDPGRGPAPECRAGDA
jgi:hypothetical protein